MRRKDKDKSKAQIVAEEVASEIATEIAAHVLKSLFRWLYDRIDGRDRKREAEIRAKLPIAEFRFAAQSDEPDCSPSVPALVDCGHDDRRRIEITGLARSAGSLPPVQ